MNTDDKLRDTLQEWLLSERQYRAGADLIRSRFVVIDRNDLPEVVPASPEFGLPEGTLRATVEYDSKGHVVEAFIGAPRSGTSDPEWHEARARAHLAAAEHLRKNPPVDEKAVEALAAAIEADPTWGEDGNPATIARRLIADGWGRVSS